MPHRKPGEITIKERKFIKAYVNGKTKKKAALAVYNTKSDHNASQIAKQVLKRPVVQEYLKQMLDRKGLSLEDLTDKLDLAITNNLVAGKPSQAVGADLLKFSYRLHEAIPSSKSVSTKLNIHAQSDPQTMAELTKTLEKLTESNKLLIEELRK